MTMQTTVKCDSPGCTWDLQIEFDAIPLWHGVACPECGAGEIVSAADLGVWRLIKAVHEVDKAIDPEGKGPYVNVRIDTAPMRFVDHKATTGDPPSPGLANVTYCGPKA